MERKSRGGGKQGIMPEWSDLPNGPLEDIARKIVALSDYIRFRSVCRRWRAVAAPSILRPQPPLILIDHHRDRDDGASFLCPSTRRLLKPNLPHLRNKAILASSSGWLVVLDLHSKALSLLNPVSADQVALPPTSCFENVEHADMAWVTFLSSSPSAVGDCTVIVLKCYSALNLAAFCRIGDASWTKIDTGSRSIPKSVASNVERFFVLDLPRNLFLCQPAQPDHPSSLGKLQVSGPLGQIFLGVIEDELYYFWIEYNYSEGDRFIAYAQLFKADSIEPLKLSYVQSFGSKALFVSVNQLFMVEVNGFTGWRAGCVYSTYLLGSGSPDEEGVSVAKLDSDICDFIPWGQSETSIDPIWLTPVLY